jgi:hypothetical protein
VFAWVLVATWGLALTASAQDLERLGMAYTDTVRVAADGTLSVRPFVIRGTVTLRSLPEGRVFVARLDAARGVLHPQQPDATPGRRVIVSYRALPIGIKTEYRLERVPLDEAVGRPGRSARPDRPPAASSPSADGLRSSGSISRGVIAGSNRDVAVESGLRLELDGELAPGVEIRASLSDADSPIRPDGTTQRLSEFDRVFIELTAQPGRVLLGDFDARLSASRFASLDRKLQGVMLETRRDGRVSVKATGATSRGQFQSQSIVPIDGVQGPYRLEGAAGERFILVLPGSEKIYVDGRLLARGESGDYVIDYSVGEISFTARTLVTSDRRISAEFQYSTNQFTRTLVASEFEATLLTDARGAERLRVGGTVIREADTGEFLSEFGLTASDSLLLSQSGDAGAARSGAQSVVYDPEARYAQYVLEVIAGDSVFVAVSARPLAGTPVYRVQFSRVGAGLGSYDRDAASINTIAYVYRGPGRGDYQAVRQLPRPVLRSVIDFRASARPVSGIGITGEWARSITDLNRLSARDSGDDGGNAFWLTAQSDTVSLGRFGGLAAQGQFRRSSASFSTFERFRDVEFAREWNLSGIALNPTGTVSGAEFERQSQFTLAWTVADSSGATADAASLSMPGVFEANRFRGTAEARLSGLPRVSYAFTGVESSNLAIDADGSWRRHFVRVAEPGGRLRWFTELESEKRLDWRLDSLRLGSAQFLELRPGLSLVSGQSSVSGQVERRTESLPRNQALHAAAESWTVSGSAQTERDSGLRADLEVAWRARRVKEGFSDQAGADTRALLLTTSGAARRGPFQFDWLYDARTERTPVLQEIYLRTGPELGAYVWVDTNGDDAVQVDELIPETTANEGTYVRTYLPSDSLASVNSVRARAVARFRPETEGALRWSGQTLFDVEERSRTNKRGDVYLLKLANFRVPGLTTSGRIRFRQDLSVFSRATGLRIEGSFQDNRSLTELAAGVETRAARLSEITFGYRASARFDASLRIAFARDETNSDRFASRRYDLQTRRAVPTARLAVGKATVSLAVDAALKSDKLVSRKAELVRVPLSVRWSRAGKADLLGRFELANVKLTGASATGLAEFELTDGRGPGRSTLWGASVQWTLSSSLRATMAYDGRAPSSGRVIHTGRVQMSALF